MATSLEEFDEITLTKDHHYLKKLESINENNVANHCTNEDKPENRKFFTINKELIAAKVVFFCYYGAVAAIMPYLTLHMKQVGITIIEIAVIYAVLPFTTFIGPPLCGFLADRFGSYKPVLISVLLINALFHSSLLMVPEYHVQFELAENLEANNATLLCNPEQNIADFRVARIKDDSNEVIGEQCTDVLLPAIHATEKLWEVSNCRPVSNCEGNVTTCSALKPKAYEFSYDFQGFHDICSEYSKTFSTDNYTTIVCDIYNVPHLSCPEVGNNSVTFWVYSILRFIAQAALVCGFTMLDATVLAICKRTDSEYGKQRVWAMVGMAALSPIAGGFVDFASHGDASNYLPAFLVADAMLVVTMVVVLIVHLEVEVAGETIWKDIGALLKHMEANIYLCMIFVLGCCWGFVESYLFIYLEGLGAPKYILGLTWTVGSTVGLPFLFFSEAIVAKMGRFNVIIFSFFAYGARFIGYSFIPNAYWCFPFEAMEAVTFHLMWCAAATYVTELAPEGLLATLSGLMGAMHYSFGKGAGSFIGGFLFEEFGLAMAFRYFGYGAIVAGTLFALLHQFYLKQKVEARQRKKAEDAKAQEGQEKQEKASSPSVVKRNGDKGFNINNGIQNPAFLCDEVKPSKEKESTKL